MGSSYAIANFQRNYYDSLTFCNEYGAFLTTISGRDEFDFVSTRFTRRYTHRYVMSEKKIANSAMRNGSNARYYIFIIHFPE